MRCLAQLLGIVLILPASFSAARAQSPAHFWSDAYGDSDEQIIESVAFDASGNVVVFGRFKGQIDFGGGVLQSSGNWNIFVAKLNANHAHVWSRRFGDNSGPTYAAFANDLAIDASGNFYIVGSFEGALDTHPDNALVSAGGRDIFIAKFASDLNPLWAKRFGDASTFQGATSVAVDASGNPVIVGYMNGSADFGGGALVSAGSWDIFIASLDTNGAHVWSRVIGGTGYDYATSVACDGAGNVLVAGAFEGTASFGSTPVVSAGLSDGFVVKYSTAGNFLWVNQYGDAANQTVQAIATQGSHIFAGGDFFGSIAIPGGSLTSAGDRDVFLLQIDSGGLTQDGVRFGDTAYQSLINLAVDDAGDVTIVGDFAGTVDFGDGPHTCPDVSDIYVAQLNFLNGFRWSGAYGAAGYQVPRAVATDAAGHVLVGGTMDGSVDFGGGALAATGLTDAFLAQFGPDAAEPAITAISDIGNDEGRQVLIEFTRSGHDSPLAPHSILQYEAYRRVDEPPAGAETLGDPASGDHEIRAEGWTQVGSVSAHGESAYSIAVPTIGDSTGVLGQYYSVFYLRAATNSPFLYFDSPPDSGYSIDNLAPGVPGGLAYSAGILIWNESPAADFAHFTIYGADTHSFGAATVVDYCIAPTMDVSSAGYVFYFVTATDLSGNEGKPAMIKTSGVGGSPESYVLSVSNYPNPFNPRTSVSYTVPSRGNVTLAIYDARGSRVATLVANEEREAGAYKIDWNGRANTSVAVASGIYFARIEQAGTVRTKKMVLLK